MQDALARLPLDDTQLLAALRDPVPAARAFAAWQARSLPTDACALALLDATADASADVRRAAWTSLGVLGERTAVNRAVKAAVNDPDAAVRAAAATAAERIAAAPSVREDLQRDVAALAGSDREARVNAARRLGNSHDRRMLEPLLAATRDASVAEAAWTALGQLGDARAVRPLVAALPNSLGRTRYAILGALAALRDESTADAVTAVLRDRDAAARQLAVRALGWIAPDDLFARLTPAGTDSVEEVRGEVLRVVEQSRHPTRIAALQVALSDPSPFLRAEAIRISADAGVLDRIPTLLADPDALVRLAAADAMLLLRPPGAAAQVREAARRARSADERTRLEAVAATLEASQLPVPSRDR